MSDEENRYYQMEIITKRMRGDLESLSKYGFVITDNAGSSLGVFDTTPKDYKPESEMKWKYVKPL